LFVFSSLFSLDIHNQEGLGAEMIFIREVDDENLETINNVITFLVFSMGVFFSSFPHPFFSLKRKQKTQETKKTVAYLSVLGDHIYSTKAALDFQKQPSFTISFLDKYANIYQRSFEFGRCLPNL